MCVVSGENEADFEESSSHSCMIDSDYLLFVEKFFEIC